MAANSWSFERTCTLAEASLLLRLSHRQVQRLGLESQYDPQGVPRVRYSLAQVEYVRAERETQGTPGARKDLRNARGRAWRRLAAKHATEFDLLLQQELMREVSAPAGSGAARTTTTTPQQGSQACPV